MTRALEYAAAIAEPIFEAVALVTFIGGLWGCLVLLAAMGDKL